jgi:Short C-terminal domain
MFGLFGPSKQDVLEEGRQAMATVRGVESTGTLVNGNPRVKLTLDVQPMGESAFTVEKKAVLPAASVPMVGQQIPVRFLPEDHDRCEIDKAALEMSQAEVVTPKGTVRAAPPPPPPPPPPKAPPTPNPAAEPVPGVPGGDLNALIQEAMASGNVTVSGSTEVVDARNVPGLRDQMAKTLGQYGITMPNLPSPGLEAGSAAGPPRPGAAEDPVEKLAKLAELKKQGVLTDAEFQAAKSKLLGEL